MRRWARYAALAFAVTAVAVLAGRIGLDAEGQAGVNAAAAVALPLQLLVFGLLSVQRTGTAAFAAVWAGGSMLRLLAVGGLAWWVARQEDVDPLWALLALAGMLFVLLLLELVELRHTGIGSNEGMERR